MENLEINTNIDKNKDLGTRMKEYETFSLDIKKIEPYKEFIVRLDGRGFSKFTSGFRKPFDLNFTKAMILATQDLITEFSAVTGYTHSDEITIIFKAMFSKEENSNIDVSKITHIFDGRAVKLLTVMSGYCSVRFNFHLIKIVNLESNKNFYDEQFINKINKMNASFDARLVVFSEDNSRGEILNHMIWRSVLDCERNAVSTYARSYFSQKELNGKGKKEMQEMLKTKGLDWEIDVPVILRFGIYLKKENYEIEVDGNKVLRSRIVGKTLKIKYDDFLINLLICKYWDVNEENAKDHGIINFDIEKEI